MAGRRVKAQRSPKSGGTIMKTTLFSLIALGAFTVTAAADPTDRAAARGPVELTVAQMDTVTAGSWSVHILPYMEQQNLFVPVTGSIIIDLRSDHPPDPGIDVVPPEPVLR
jgi:hypothetical protein